MSCSYRKIAAPEQTIADASTGLETLNESSCGELKLLLNDILPIKIGLNNAAILFA
jgi:hypothetical protein